MLSRWFLNIWKFLRLQMYLPGTGFLLNNQDPSVTRPVLKIDTFLKTEAGFLLHH